MRGQGQDHSGALGSPGRDPGVLPGGSNEDLLKAAGHDQIRSSSVLRMLGGTGKRMSQPSRKFPSDSLTLK